MSGGDASEQQRPVSKRPGLSHRSAERSAAEERKLVTAAPAAPRDRQPDSLFAKSFGFSALGWAQAKGSEPRFAFKTPAGLVVLRSRDIMALSGLALLCPDLSVWRRYFPRGRGRVDSAAAGAFLIGQCRAAGLCELPPELAPRPAGRPKKAPAA